MIRSRVILATIDAAAMEMLLASPFTIAQPLTSSGILFPSTKTKSGFLGRAAIARFMANRLARRMFISSISAGLHWPVYQIVF